MGDTARTLGNYVGTRRRLGNKTTESGRFVVLIACALTVIIMLLQNSPSNLMVASAADSTTVASRMAPTLTLPPNIIFILADDLGYANVGFNRATPPVPTEVRTPNIDALAASGLVIDRLYTYMFCSPTRSSLLSGRVPYHVNTLNADPAVWNSTSGEGAGIATHMQTLAEVLKPAKYHTAVVGKWCVCVCVNACK